MQRLETTRGVSLTIHKGLPLASGIGSSGASAVAAVVAANELLGRPAPMPVLLECAMAGEQAGCGAVHPDNVTPSLYGGFILARSAQPPDIVRLPVPEGLACAVLHPKIEVETGAARRLIGDQVALKDAVRQWANVGGLVAALYTSDLALLSRSLVDSIAEPRRASLVPGFFDVKAAAMAAGALGGSLSGSGPSVFALAASIEIARAAGDAMQRAFDKHSSRWLRSLGLPGWAPGRPGRDRSMICVSTRGKAPAVSLKEAVLAGLAPDGGLYVPRRFRGSLNPGGRRSAASPFTTSPSRSRWSSPATNSITPR